MWQPRPSPRAVGRASSLQLIRGSVSSFGAGSQTQVADSVESLSSQSARWTAARKLSMRCSLNTLDLGTARLLILVSKMALMWSGSPSVPERGWLSGRAVAFLGAGGGPRPASAVRPRRP